jgi:hypothetical protein
MAEAATGLDSATPRGWDWGLWRRWVGANALAEFVGLGGSFLVVGVMLTLVSGETVGSVLLVAGVSILLGTFLEGVLVGLLQWSVLRCALPDLPRRSWVLATAAGAFVAWMLGMLPSTILSLGQSAASTTAAAAPMPEPPVGIILLLATAMGFVLGPVLSAAQWVVLRRYVRRAGWWIPANGLAWSVGMTLVFVGTTFIPSGPVYAWVIALLLGCVLAAGAAVGAIHGLALIWLIQQR